MFYHPALGKSLPTLAILLENADEMAAALLIRAGRFAALRQQRDALCRQALWENDDWVGPPRILAETPSVISQGDVLKAFFSFSEVAEDFFAQDAAKNMLAQTISDAQKQLLQAPPPLLDQEIDFSWGQCYILQKSLGKETHLTILRILAMLDDRGLAHLVKYLEMYQDGLIAEIEGLNFIKGKVYTSESFPVVPQVFVDSQDHFKALDHIGPVCWIFGDQNRITSLIRAWGVRQKYVYPEGYQQGAHWLYSFQRADQALVVEEQAWFSLFLAPENVENAGGGDLEALSADELERMVKYAQTQKAKLFLVGSLEVYKKISTLLPDLSEVPTIHVPEWSHQERLLCWCAALPRARRPGGCRPTIHEMIQGFFGSPRHDTSLSTLETALSGDLQSQPHPLRGAMHRVKYGKPLTERQLSLVNEHVGSLDALQQLCEFAKLWNS